ncbi:MAG: hypothetical protein H7Z72_20645 [Bacteroidetes bacterium]|nr:hypothetical protein [Fibrella sp.]
MPTINQQTLGTMRQLAIRFAATLLPLLTGCSVKYELPPPTTAATPPAAVTTAQPATTTAVTPQPAQANNERPLEGSLHPMGYRSLIDSQATYTATLRPERLADLPLSVDFGGLAKNGQPPRLIALGGSLTAGIRNGGLYREGQLTAYPNLVARQMAIADFRSPTFGTSEANGTGFLTYSDPGAAYPRWRQVSNQLAPVRGGDPPVLSPYTGKVDNFAAPGMNSEFLNFLWRPNSTAYHENGRRWFPFQPYLWRYMAAEQNQATGLADYIVRNKDYDLFLLEDRTEGWLKTLRTNELINQFSYLYEFTIGQFSYKSTAAKLAQGGKRGVVFTVPHFEDFAFMQWYPTGDLKRKASSINISFTDKNYADLRQLNTSEPFFLMPTPAVAALFEGLKQGDGVTATLTDADVMTRIEAALSDPAYYNGEVRKMAKELNLALVDLNALYKQIHQGSYVAEGGLRIDGSPKGNFFSSDGTYPTAIGQAVIANEVIKAINSRYGSRIPLLNVTEFIQTTGAK